MKSSALFRVDKFNIILYFRAELVFNPNFGDSSCYNFIISSQDINMAMALDLDIDLDPENEDIYDLLETTNNMITEALNIINDGKALMNHDIRPADPQNSDIFRLLMEHKDRILELRTSIEQYKLASNTTLMEHRDRIRELRNNIEQYRIASSSLPSTPSNRPMLQRARGEDIKPLLDPSKRLGSGAFGEVYKVKYRGQTVALKHMNNINQEG